MPNLRLAKANVIIRAAFKRAEELGLKPLTIAVLDAGGHLKALQAQDGTSFLRPKVAHGKAYGALAVGQNSRALNKAALERPHFVQALNGLTDGALVPVPGGVLMRDGRGNLMGAVGITGDTSDNDEACAVAGIEAAGFVADAE